MDTDDRFIAGMRDAARKMAAHDHGPRPSVGAPDLYCLNLSSWAGERTAALLARYDAAVLRAIDAEQAHQRDREEWEHTKQALAANARAHADLTEQYEVAVALVATLQAQLAEQTAYEDEESTG